MRRREESQIPPNLILSLLQSSNFFDLDSAKFKYIFFILSFVSLASTMELLDNLCLVVLMNYAFGLYLSAQLMLNRFTLYYHNLNEELLYRQGYLHHSILSAFFE